MSRLVTPYRQIIDKFDAIGWIPTIRGGLSLNVFDDSESLLGDVDKYSTEIKIYNGFKSSRYLAASSLFAFKDRKKGRNYRRAFRFVFRGSINDIAKQDAFLQDTFEESQYVAVKSLFEEKDILIGRLSIISLPNKLNKRRITEQENELLLALKELQSKKNQYDKAFRLFAEDLKTLENMRTDLKSIWSCVEAKMSEFEMTLEANDDKKSHRVYKFDVILSRDGILFLKDKTHVLFRGDYFEKGTPSDYTLNIPIHRIFKTALHFITSLFHKNYHHPDEHDAFLPVSNLHPIKKDASLRRLVKHQVDAFLCPIIKAKRDLGDTKANILCDPEGVLPYFESFIHVSENNQFVDKKDADVFREFINTQSKEYEVRSSDVKSIRSSFLAQRNPWARITVGLAVLAAVIATFDFVINDIPVFCNLSEAKKMMFRGIIAFSGFVLGWIIHEILLQKYTYRGVLIKRERNNLNRILNIDSDTSNRKLSRRYAFRLFLLKETPIGKRTAYVLKLLSLILFIATIIFLYYYYVL
jgi:hypothetical protein